MRDRTGVPRAPRHGRHGVGLTRRERQILRLLASARSQREIALLLMLSHHTVDTHTRKLYRKLNVRSRAHAVAIALRGGLI